MFYGKSEAIYDDKNRISFPARLNDAEGNNSFYIVAFEDRAVLYPKNEKTEKLFWSLNEEEKRYVFSNMYEAKIDGSRRITIPLPVVEKLKFKQYPYVYIIGIINKIEIWNPQMLKEKTFGVNILDPKEKKLIL